MSRTPLPFTVSGRGRGYCERLTRTSEVTDLSLIPKGSPGSAAVSWFERGHRAQHTWPDGCSNGFGPRPNPEPGMKK